MPDKDVFDTDMLRAVLYGPKPAYVKHPGIESLRRRLDTDPAWRPTVPVFVPYLHLYRDQPNNAVGGCLRPMLSGNERDGDIEADRRHAVADGDEDGVTLCDALLRMSVTQRSRAGDFFDCEFSPNAKPASDRWWFQDCVREWVAANKRCFLVGVGIKAMQVRGGAFEFQLWYSGVSPYFGRRWAGMLNSLVIGPVDNSGEFYAVGKQVCSNQVPFDLEVTGTFVGLRSDLFDGQNLNRLLQHAKLSDPMKQYRFRMPPPGATWRLTHPQGVWEVVRDAEPS